jgi:hypothetical protein
VKFVRMLSVVALVLFAVSIARADGIDTQLNINRGPTGSPPPPGTVVVTANTANGTGGFDGSSEFTVNVFITKIVSIMPAADWTPPQVCLSNAYVVNGGLGVAPVPDGNGNLVCTFTAATANPSDSGESLAKLMADCQNSNLGLISDFDDCIGIPADGTSDIIYGIFNAGISGAQSTSINTFVPEPGSLPLLLVGFAGLPFIRRKLCR